MDVPKRNLTPKEHVTNIPNYAKGHTPYVGETANVYANRIMRDYSGPGDDTTSRGPTSDHNRIRKRYRNYEKP